MDDRLPPKDTPRFNGKIRHYHRSGVRQRSWDEWVEGDRPLRKKSRLWGRLVRSIALLFVIAAIVAGYLAMAY